MVSKCCMLHSSFITTSLFLQQLKRSTKKPKFEVLALGIHKADNCYRDSKLVLFPVNAIVMVRRNNCKPFAVIIEIGKYHVYDDH